jgi:curved DNA-binding protein CbpA
MNSGPIPDYYELLQVSPRADSDTIERVFRHLAKRLHPDNVESGDADRFTTLLEAFRVLSDPERRARYDVQYDAATQVRWQVFGGSDDVGDAATDRRIQAGILGILFRARRNDADRPGVGTIDLERLLGCPQEHIRFHLWYLKEQGWITRLDTGLLAITAAGVDRALEMNKGAGEGLQLLRPAPEPVVPPTAATG